MSKLVTANSNFKDIIELVVKIKELDTSTKRLIYNAYTSIIMAKMNESTLADVHSKLEEYALLSSSIIVETLFYEKQSEAYVEAQKNTIINQFLSNRKEFIDIRNKVLGNKADSIVLTNINQILEAIISIETPIEVKFDDEEVTNEGETSVEELDELDTFGFDVDEEDLLPDDTEESIFEEDDEWNEEFTEEDLKESVSEQVKEEKADTESSESSEVNKDEYERFRDKYGEIIFDITDGMSNAFSQLYESCYSGTTSPEGILVSDGLISFEKNHDTSKMEFVMNHGKSGRAEQYKQMYKAVMYALGTLYGGAPQLSKGLSLDRSKQVISEAVASGEKLIGSCIDGRKDTKDVLPKYKDTKNGKYIYPRLHLEFMTGMLSISDDLKEWSKNNKVKKSSTKITAYKDMDKWIRHRLEECIIKSCLAEGMKADSSSVDAMDIQYIGRSLCDSIKNVIAITNHRKGFTTLKISSNNEGMDANAIGNRIVKLLNWATSSSGRAYYVVKSNEADVIEIDIVRDKNAYEASSSFASSVIDAIIESGKVPRWSNAVLGETDDGKAFTYNFEEKCSVAIYGATGSGKGIMTSALITNAIIDNCHVFYFDGKPDNGAALGKVAWDVNIGDAPVFNGLTGGSDVFQNCIEEYSHGIRDVAWRTKCEKMVPILEYNASEPCSAPWPFNDGELRRQLIETSFTLVAFQFVHDMVLARNLSENRADKRWAVFIIDEIEDAAYKEKMIREKMKEYMDIVGEREIYEQESKTDRNGNVTTKDKKVGKIKDAKFRNRDTGYKFCLDWLQWANNCCSNWETATTKGLRNGHCTIITLFQSNGWLTQDEKGAGKTKIGKLMLKVGQKTTRVVGKGALRSKNQFGDELKYSWSDKVEQGKWAIATGDSSLSNSDTVFKPFKCFTTDLGAKVKVELDDRGAGSDKCKKFKNDNGADPLGLQSYLIYLFNGMKDIIQEDIASGRRINTGLTAAEVLHSSFDYFDNISRKLHKGYNGLLDFMYDIPVISKRGLYSNENNSGVDTDVSAEDLYEASDCNEDTDKDPEDVARSTADYYNSYNSGDSEQSSGSESTSSFGDTSSSSSFGSTGGSKMEDILENAKRQTNNEERAGTSSFDGFDKASGREAYNERGTAREEVKQASNPKIRPMSFKSFSTLDNELKAANIDRIYDEIETHDFNLNAREIRYGLKHLCWNISILYMSKSLDASKFKSNTDFVTNYAGSIERGIFSPDYVPDEKQVQVLRLHIDNIITPEGAFKKVESFRNIDLDKEREYNDISRQAMMEREELADTEEQGISWERQTSRYNPYKDPKAEILGFRNEVNYSRDTDTNIIKVDRSKILTPEVFLMNEDNSVTFGKNPIYTKFTGLMNKSSMGTGYMLKSRSKELLRAIDNKFKDISLVKRVIIATNNLIINGKQVETDVLADDEYGIEFGDFVKVLDIMERYKYIEDLTLSYDMWRQVVLDLNLKAEDCGYLFRKYARLNVLKVELQPSTDVKVITREQFRLEEDNLKRATKMAELQDKMDVACSVHNRHKEGMGVGAVDRLRKSSKNHMSKAGKRLKSSDPLAGVNLVAGVAFGTLGIALSAIGAAGSEVMNLIGRYKD